jgi:hypothetical protein
MMRPSGNHVAAALLRAISACGGVSTVDRQKPTMIVEEIVSTDWASATFVGATHAFSLRFEGDGVWVAETFRALEGLPEREIAIPGHIVAELVATPGPTQHMDDNMIAKNLTVNVLTIID